MRVSHRYVGVDLLRFAAASLVMFFHLALWSWVAPNGTTATIVRGAVSFPELQSFAAEGWIGVQIFFVISGFVIAFSAASATPLSFLRRRFLRLFPGAVITTAITAAVLVAEGVSTFPALGNRVFNSVTFNPFGPWIDGVYWTLGVEISFYGLVFALLVLRRANWIAGIVAVIGVASSALAVAHVWLAGAPSISPLLAFSESRTGELLLLKHGMFFCLGVMLWVATERGWSPTRAAVALVCVAGGLAQIASVSVGPHVAPAAIAIWLAAMAFLFAAIARDDVAARLAGRAGPAIALIGLATYPLYLVHDVSGAAVMRELALAGVPRFVALALAMIAMVALALLVTRFPERWLRGLLAQIFAGREPARAGMRLSQ